MHTDIYIQIYTDININIVSCVYVWHASFQASRIRQDEVAEEMAPEVRPQAVAVAVLSQMGLLQNMSNQFKSPVLLWVNHHVYISMGHGQSKVIINHQI